MADIRIVWSPEMMAGDWALTGSVLDTTRELVTALAVSLFTDRLAEDDDPLPDWTTDRRGWWADHEADLVHGATPIGSRLWLIAREKQTDETRLRAEAYIREAVAWMIQARLATDIDVAVDWFAFERLGADVTIYRGPASSIAVRFETLWEQLR